MGDETVMLPVRRWDNALDQFFRVKTDDSLWVTDKDHADSPAVRAMYAVGWLEPVANDGDKFVFRLLADVSTLTVGNGVA